MKHKITFLLGLLIALMAIGSLAVINAQPRIEAEVIPTSVYDQGLPTVSIPFFQDGRLFLSHVDKFARDGKLKEASREGIGSVMYKTISLLDVNRATGQFLYQVDRLNQPSGTELGTPGLDIWLSDADGKSTKIFEGGFQAKLSPSGKYIAVNDAETILHLIDLNGRKLRSYGLGISQVFSPDGKKIALYRNQMDGIQDLGGLQVVSTYTGRVLATFDPEPGNQYYPLVFSDDSETLFLTADAKSEDESGNNRVDVYKLSIKTGQAKLVTTGTDKLMYIGFDRAFYLPDSHLLVISDGETIKTINTDTGKVTSHENISDMMYSGSGNTFYIRSSNVGLSSDEWETITLQ